MGFPKTLSAKIRIVTYRDVKVKLVVYPDDTNTYVTLREGCIPESLFKKDPFLVEDCEESFIEDIERIFCITLQDKTKYQLKKK
jgi:hypothetical protein